MSRFWSWTFGRAGVKWWRDTIRNEDLTGEQIKGWNNELKPLYSVSVPKRRKKIIQHGDIL